MKKVFIIKTSEDYEIHNDVLEDTRENRIKLTSEFDCSTDKLALSDFIDGKCDALRIPHYGDWDEPNEYIFTVVSIESVIDKLLSKKAEIDSAINYYNSELAR